MNETRGSQRSGREIIARRKAASASRKISRPQALSIATQSLEVEASTVVGITIPVTELAMPVRAVTIPALVCSALWVAAACASEFVADPIKVSSPWSRATPERAKVGGGFMTVTNTGKEEDRLIGASSEIAGSIEIHEMRIVNGVMMMRHLNPGITIKPGSSIILKPFSHHLMFMDLKQTLVAGQTIKATLVFEKAGKVDIELAVVPLGSDGPSAGASKTK